MTPKEKAEDLVMKYFNWYGDPFYFNIEKAKQCALIAVDEIIESKTYRDTPEEYEYWYEVKEEINNL